MRTSNLFELVWKLLVALFVVRYSFDILVDLFHCFQAAMVSCSSGEFVGKIKRPEIQTNQPKTR